jgi:hypothetical protein
LKKTIIWNIKNHCKVFSSAKEFDSLEFLSLVRQLKFERSAGVDEIDEGQEEGGICKHFKQKSCKKPQFKLKRLKIRLEKSRFF